MRRPRLGQPAGTACAAGIALALLLAACGGGGAEAADAGPTPTVQEGQCHAAGWSREVVAAAGAQRLVLWKAPPVWSQGAIVVMHGGGGSHTNFCVANVALTMPQVRFTESALAQGFAVFLLDSSDQVRDLEGRICGKVWDDEVRPRANLDLPFIDDVLRRVIPARRPGGSRAEIFLVGHSSGGFMAVRAASALAPLVTAFAPVAAGDPYGWFRDCSPRPGDRSNVFGAGFDLETRRQIPELGACESALHPNERPWDEVPAARKPAVRLFHHAQDGIVDRSCVAKLQRQLQSRGYAPADAFVLDAPSRSVDVHYWQDAYNEPLLAWLRSQLR